MRQAANVRRFMPDGELKDVADAVPGAVDRVAPSDTSVTIYTMPPSLCSQRVRMTLLEKKVPYEERVVNTAMGENLEPEYLRLNPRGVVPTLVVDGQALFDSATIMRFVDNRFDGPELAPSDARALTSMNEWMRRSDDFPIRGFTYRAHLASGLPDYWRVGMHYNIIRARDRYPEHRALYDLKLADWADLIAWMDSSDDAAEGESCAFGLADDAEAALSNHRFLTGDAVSLADISVFVLLMRLQCGCDVRLWGRGLRARIEAFVERMKSRPSYDGAVLAPYRTGGPVRLTGDCWLPKERAA